MLDVKKSSIPAFGSLVAGKQMKKRREPELYHLPTDPKQTTNLYEKKSDVVNNLLLKKNEFLKSLRAESR